MNHSLSKHLFLLLLAFFPALSFGGWGIVDDITLTPVNGNPALVLETGAKATVKDDRFTPGAPLPSFIKYGKVQTKIVLGIDKNYLASYYGTPFTCSVNLGILTKDAASASSFETKVLTVSYDPGRNQTEDFMAVYTLEGSHQTEVSVLAISMNGSPVSLPNSNVYLRTLIQLERYFNIPADIFSTDPVSLGQTHSLSTSTLDVGWGLIDYVGYHLEPEFFELEWTFCEVFQINANEKREYTYNFKNNATNVTLRGQGYAIPMIYPEGTLVWRIRAAGYDTVSKKYYYTDWNVPESGTLERTGSGSAMNQGGSPVQYAYYFGGHAPGHNWQHSVSFAEEGKHKQLISYFDGLKYRRQTLTKSNTDSRTLVGQTIYDFHRRPAIQVLPVPSMDQPHLGYRSLFAKSSAAGSPQYSWKDFDLDAGEGCRETQTYSMAVSAGASRYYSASNPLSFPARDIVPDAEKYPFTQTEYMPDNTGRIRRQSGAGMKHRLSGLDDNASPVQGKESLFFYDRPLQTQLDRLFGNSVGYANHYQRNIAVDPNGQISISYLDPAGRVIATALAGDPANSPNVEDLGDHVISFETRENLKNTQVSYDDYTLVSHLEHTVTTAGVYAIAYELTVPKYTDECMPENFCFDCIYELSVSLTDECGNELIQEQNLKYFRGESAYTGPVTVDESCHENAFSIRLRPTPEQEAGQESLLHLELPLTVGKYSLYKKLSVSKAAAQAYADLYMENLSGSCSTTLQDFIDEEKTRLDYTNCGLDCGDCALMSEPDKSACLEMCRKRNGSCQLLRLQLEADVSPGGQYFDNQQAYDPQNPQETYNTQYINSWLDGLRMTGQTATDDDVNGIPDVLEELNTQYGSSHASWEQLRRGWKEEYAAWMLEFHPEYCYLEKCEAIQASYDFDLEMQETTSATEAQAAGFFNPLNNTASGHWSSQGLIDPAFNSLVLPASPLLAQLSTMRDTHLPAIWAAVIALRTSSGQSDITGSADLSTSPNSCKTDYEWAYFRALYLAKKTELLASHYSSCGVSIPPGKAQRFFPDAESALTAGGLDPATGNHPAYIEDMDDYCLLGCESQVKLWMGQLKGCKIAEAHLEILQEELEQICKNGCLDKTHPIGNSSSRLATVNGNTTFKEALDWLMKAYRYTPTSLCNDLLLETPYDGQAGLHQGQARLDDCACQKVLDNKIAYQNSPGASCSPMELFESTYNQQVEDLLMLECLCQRKQDPSFNSAECSRYLGGMSEYGFTGPDTSNFVFSSGKKCMTLAASPMPVSPEAVMFDKFLGQLLRNDQIFSGEFYLNEDYAEFIGPDKLFNTSCSLKYTTTDHPGIPGPGDIHYAITISDAPCGSFECKIDLYTKDIPLGLSIWIPGNPGTIREVISNDSFSMNYEGHKIYGSTSCVDLLCQPGSQEIYLPDVYVPAELTCDKCLNCADIQGYYAMYAQQYPYYSGAVDNPVEYFRKYLRSHHAMDYSLEALHSYMKGCGMQADTSCTTTPAAADFFNVLTEMVATRDLGKEYLVLPNSFKNSSNLYSGGCTPALRSKNLLFYIPSSLETVPIALYPIAAAEMNVYVRTPVSVSNGGEFPMAVQVVAASAMAEGATIQIHNTSGSLLPGQDFGTSMTLPQLSPGDTFYVESTLTAFEHESIAGKSEYSLNLSSGDMLLAAASFQVNTNTNPPLFLDPNLFKTPRVKEFAITDGCGMDCQIRLIMPEENMDLRNITSVVPGSLEEDPNVLVQSGGFVMKVYYKGRPEPIEVEVFSSCHTFTGCSAVNNNPVSELCPMTPLPEPVKPDPCTAELNFIAESNAMQRYQTYLNAKREQFLAAYMNKCMEPLETFTLEFSEKEYHHTLYYFDKAGNLVKTVPPQDVDNASPFLSGTSLENVHKHRTGDPSVPNPVYPVYDYLTLYKYNTLSQLIWQKSPDGGESKFWYDYLGRLVLSQNAKQQPNDEYTYTRFDNLGRVIESGQIELNPVDLAVDSVASPTRFAILLANAAATKTEITKTWYDEPMPGLSAPITQENLRLRVASVAIYPTNTGNYSSATHYSYDALGNAQVVMHDIPELEPLEQRYKQTAYDFDLASGKMNFVKYQQEQPDQISHYYRYDADNRIQEAYTSLTTPAEDLDNAYYIDPANTPEWTQHARYYYYPTGPLSRVETGRFKVQGTDFAYTLHGWIKGVNAELLKPNRDPGLDGYNSPGQPHRQVSYDIFSYTLGYYAGDYKQIGTGNSFMATTTGSGYLAARTGKDLYNGNISWMTTTLPDSLQLAQNKLLVASPRGETYTYDQLNRLTASENFMASDWVSYAWNSGASSGAYNTHYTYDARGNILTLDRNGKPGLLQMDQLQYHYTAGTNQLTYIDDLNPNPANYTSDLKDQSTGNYTYDPLGNLQKDQAADIEQITWNLYGKVKKVKFTALSGKNTLEFAYNAMGQRIMKREILTNGKKETWYSLDAQGNVMAVYTLISTSDMTTSKQVFALEDHLLYGSQRIGTISRQTILAEIQKPVADPDPAPQLTPMPDFKSYTHQLGRTSYELSNHLGNVMAVITDRPIPYNSSGAVDHFEPDVSSFNDYYPFGMTMPQRSYTGQINVCSNSSSATGNTYATNRHQSTWTAFGAATATYKTLLNRQEIEITGTSAGASITVSAPAYSTPPPGTSRHIQVETTIRPAHSVTEIALYDNASNLVAGPYLIPPGEPVPMSISFERTNSPSYTLRITGDHLDLNTQYTFTDAHRLTWQEEGTADAFYDPLPDRQQITLTDKDDYAYYRFITPHSGELVEMDFTIEAVATDLIAEIYADNGSTLLSAHNISKGSIQGFTPSFNSTHTNAELRIRADWDDAPTYHLTGAHTLPWTNIGTATTSGATTVQYTSTGSGVSQVFNPPAGERIYVDLEVITTQSAVQITITDMSTSLPVATTSVPGWANASPTLSFFSTGASYEIKLIGTTPAVYPDYFGISRFDVRTWTKPFQPGILYVSNLDIETNLPVTNEIIYITKLDFTEVTITTSEVCGDVERDYRYGFGGYEKDNEVKGKEGSYNMGARLYDPRIGRTPTIDRYWKEYESFSPYSFAGNSPITFLDPDGNIIKIGTIIYTPGMQVPTDVSIFTQNAIVALNFVHSQTDEESRMKIEYLANHKATFPIVFSDKTQYAPRSWEKQGKSALTTYYNDRQAAIYENGVIRPNVVGLAHELEHAYMHALFISAYFQAGEDYEAVYKKQQAGTASLEELQTAEKNYHAARNAKESWEDGLGIDKEEQRAVKGMETSTSRALGVKPRVNYELRVNRYFVPLNIFSTKEDLTSARTTSGNEQEVNVQPLKANTAWDF